MFALSPECLCSLLLAPRMRDDEALLLAGMERFSATSGYSRSFAFDGDFVDAACGHVAPGGAALGGLTGGSARTTIVAFDAINFSRIGGGSVQIQPRFVHRELVKAAAAFGLGQEGGAAWPPEGGGGALPVATGNWGCGVYGGHPALKAALQWLAASAAGRPIIYHCYRNAELAAALAQAQDTALQRCASVASLYAAIMAHEWPADDPANPQLLRALFA